MARNENYIADLHASAVMLGLTEKEAKQMTVRELERFVDRELKAAGHEFGWSG